MTPSPSQCAQEAVACCLAQGFALAGVCDAAPDGADLARLREWLDAGKHGSMGYMAEQAAARLDPSRVLAGARSVVMVADQYAPRGDTDRPGAGMGRVARYARGRDYHLVMKKRLHDACDALAARFPGESFRAFVDTAPVLERPYAARAGLGWTGKNTLLIHPRRGSYLLLGGILTTLHLAPPPEQAAVTDHCGACTRCIDACPTGAITGRSVDARRCISYLTIERRLPIAPEFHSAIGDWLYGCDVCQEVCPHNSRRPDGPGEKIRPGFAPRLTGFDLLAVLGWGEGDRRAAFESSAMKRATLAMMKRNAVIVAGNQLRAGAATPGLRERLGQLARDAAEPGLVRDTARAVLESLDGDLAGRET
jgi:epoxyqueuosine reductase